MELSVMELTVGAKEYAGIATADEGVKLDNGFKLFDIAKGLQVAGKSVGFKLVGKVEG